MSTAAMRQPDIEIYLKDADQAAVTAWLEQVLGSPILWQTRGQTYKTEVSHDGAVLPVTWLPKAVGKWHSLYLESAHTPWPDDLACARDASAALEVEVRCAPGGWEEHQGEDDADRWLKVRPDGSSEEFLWRTG